MSKLIQNCLTVLCFSVCLLFFGVQHAQAQRKLKQMDADKQKEEDKYKEDTKQPLSERFSYGGNIGAQFGTGYSSFLLQPLVFFKAAEKTTLGGGFTYSYWSQKYTGAGGRTETYSDNVLGLNLFARQTLFEPLFVHVEYNPINFTLYDYVTRKEERIWHHAFYVGGGLNQRFSGKGGYYIMLLYDVAWNANRTFYPTPYDMRMGFYF